MKKNDHLAQKPDDIAEATDAASLAQGVIEDHADIQSAQAEAAAARGEFEPFKTTSLFDGTARNPEWLGEEPQRLQQLMPE